jgi:hypothetical protein
MTIRSKDTGIITSEGYAYLTRNYSSNFGWNYTSSAERRYFGGVDIPNFHARKKRGELLPHTPFSQHEWVGEHLAGHYDWQFNSQTASITDYDGFAFGTPYRLDELDHDGDLSSAPDMTYAQSYIQQAAARIYSKGWDALTFGAETPKLRKQFKGLAGRMLDMAKGHRSDRILKLWLEGRYAWRTLAYDVADLHDAMLNFEKDRQIHTERAGYSYSSSSDGTIDSGSDSAFDFTLESSVSHEYSIRGAVAGRINPARISIDPIRTAWELVPYSFVVDWVIDVGSAIEAFQFVRNATEYTASRGYQDIFNVTFTCNGLPKDGYSGSAQAVWNYQGTTQSRSPSSVSAIPQFNPRDLTPDIALDLNALSRLRARL